MKSEFHLLLKEILIKLNLFNIAKKYLIYFNMFNKFKISLGTINSVKILPKLYLPSLKLNKGKQLKKLFSKIEISISDEGFIFFIDEFKTTASFESVISNISIDYGRVINSSLSEMRLNYSQNDDYSINQMDTLDATEILINRVIVSLKKSNRSDKEKFIQFFENIKSKHPSSFEEALQRILFFNQLLWQTGHKLNGFGRLDKILNDIYEKDSISKNQALLLIKNFLEVSHSYYSYKSHMLLGDTGQIIVLGGLEEDNTYFYNDLTSLFIKAINDLQLPDPKLILRYSSKTPREIMELSLRCMSTGVGSPLISNDDLVINNLIEFGYDLEDACNYVVSACWEPAPVGKGLEMNNVDCLIFIQPLNNLLDNEDLNSFESFDLFLDKYKLYLNKYIDELLSNLVDLKWENDPIMSFFVQYCDNNFKDISEGGAKYNNYGLTSVSLSNTVNSLINIKHFVFDKKEYTLDEFNGFRLNNFTDELILDKIKHQTLKFGNDNSEILYLTNEIIKTANDNFKNYKNYFGGQFKFGLSAPTYITKSKDVMASCDGRKEGEPFNVHISLDDNKDYTELMRFASKLDYSESKFNGNVVDLMVSPSFINNNFDKFLDFLILSLKIGVFQIQLNVVDSKILIDAKQHPDKYPNLIVRVWGFSAYFNDLPVEYQDNLIKRALDNESYIQ